MSLVNCRECRMMVSSKAAACPHCGHKMKMSSGKAGCLIILAAAALFIGLPAIMGGKDTSGPSSRPEVRKTSGREIELSEFKTEPMYQSSSSYRQMRWAAAVKNNGDLPATGHVWLGGVDADGYTDKNLCAYRISDLQPGQTVKFSMEATIPEHDTTRFKSWTVSWYKLN